MSASPRLTAHRVTESSLDRLTREHSRTLAQATGPTPTRHRIIWGRGAAVSEALSVSVPAVAGPISSRDVNAELTRVVWVHS